MRDSFDGTVNEFERARYKEVYRSFVSMDADRTAQCSEWAEKYLLLIEQEKQAKRDLGAICKGLGVAKVRVITETTALQRVYELGFQHGESPPEGYGAAITDLFEAQKLLEATSCQVELQQQLYENVMQRVNLLAQEIFGEVELECLWEDIQGTFVEL